MVTAFFSRKPCLRSLYSNYLSKLVQNPSKARTAEPFPKPIRGTQPQNTAKTAIFGGLKCQKASSKVPYRNSHTCKTLPPPCFTSSNLPYPDIGNLAIVSRLATWIRSHSRFPKVQRLWIPSLKPRPPSRNANSAIHTKDSLMVILLNPAWMEGIPKYGKTGSSPPRTTPPLFKPW